jgi:hypothetical protein
MSDLGDTVTEPHGGAVVTDRGSGGGREGCPFLTGGAALVM